MTARTTPPDRPPGAPPPQERGRREAPPDAFAAVLDSQARTAVAEGHKRQGSTTEPVDTKDAVTQVAAPDEQNVAPATTAEQADERVGDATVLHSGAVGAPGQHGGDSAVGSASGTAAGAAPSSLPFAGGTATPAVADGAPVSNQTSVTHTPAPTTGAAPAPAPQAGESFAATRTASAPAGTGMDATGASPSGVTAGPGDTRARAGGLAAPVTQPAGGSTPETAGPAIDGEQPAQPAQPPAAGQSGRRDGAQAPAASAAQPATPASPATPAAQQRAAAATSDEAAQLARPQAAPAQPATPAQPAAPATPSPLHGPPAHAPVRGARLEQAVESVEHVIRLGSARGVTHARLTLRPAELGGVEIRLSSTSDGLVARLSADTPQAAQVLHQGGAELRRMLEAQGLNVLRLDIALSGDERAHSREDGAAGRDGERRGDASREGAETETTSTESALRLPNGVLVDVLA